ncbi:MAG: SGNH/GDSL hydrolase family protein, partial [Clostridia bacterium]|nr:SGNH/GDSL hydrolase family protein [Clostridia bacterium]
MKFKQFLSLVLGFSTLTLACSCNPKSSSPADSSDDGVEIDHDLTEFDLQKYLSPVWSGNVSYAESAFVLQNENGKIDPIQLLYDIDEIISVRSYDLKTLYEEGVDYKVTNGKLEILEGGSIPFLEHSKYHLSTYQNDGLQTQIPASDNSGTAYIVAETTKSNPGMSAWSLAVTYKHSSKSVITTPEDNSIVFEEFILKLQNKENVKAVFYGDSITYGWGSSSLAEVSRDPFCPSYPNLVLYYLEDKYDVTIERANHSRSGETTNWAKEYSNYIKVVDENPDIVILAFGMNDGGAINTDTFVANIKGIMRNITNECKSKWNKEVPIVVVGTMIPNDKVGFQPGSCILNYQR